MRLFFDGWYACKDDAAECLKQCEQLGAASVGLVECEHETWGILYWSRDVIFENHVIMDVTQRRRRYGEMRVPNRE